MNRRNFLRSMAVISASGLSVGVLGRLAAETQHVTLAALLNQAEPICESLLHGSSFDSLDVPPTLNFALQELAQLIEHGLRIIERPIANFLPLSGSRVLTHSCVHRDNWPF